MAARKEFPVKVRRVAVTNKKTGVKYIEERRYQYDPAKGYNVLLSSRRTGEKILEGETVTTRCRPKKKPAEAAQTAELSAKRTRVGALDLIRHAGAVAGLESSVRRAYPNGGTSEKLLSVSQYLVATGETVHNVEPWQCEHDLPYEAGLSEDICYDLFHELGLDESGSQSLFRELARTAGNDEQPAIAFDSTSHSVYGNGQKPYARQGFNKDGDGLDIYKIITFCLLDSGLPVSFELQPGNIPDVISLVNAVPRAKAYGLKNPEFCLDHGFFSKENVLRFLRKNFKFTILATLKHAWIYKHLDSAAEDGTKLRDHFSRYASQCPFDEKISAVSVSEMTPFEWKRQRTRNGVAAGDTESKSFRLYFHYFRNNARAVMEASAFRTKLKSYEMSLAAGKENEMDDAELEFAHRYFSWKRVRGGGIKVIHNEEAIQAAQKDFGIFVILSNLHASPWDVLRRYRRRNDIETSYRVVKSDLDGRKPRVWTMTSVRGKEICRHVALGYCFVLQSMMERTAQEAERRANDESLGKTVRKQYEKLTAWIRSMTLKQLLDWFDCVERVEVRNRVAQYRWSTETTARDQMFLELFFDESD